MPKDHCLTERFLVTDDFMPADSAASMRADIDAHFADPYRHNDRQETWNFWHVPGTYTYLRTTPEKVIEKAKVAAFVERLRLFAAVELGFANVTWPFLGFYVPGCLQVLHNDTTNGRLGYVYSLTRNERKTTGGETIVMQDRDLFRGNLETAAAGAALFDLIEPRFNRLSLFDDRVPHGVQRVEGVMDPLEGRFVLHGHIREGGVVIQGALKPDAVREPVVAALGDLRDSVPSSVFGAFVLRFEIAADGSLTRVRPILDRLACSRNTDLAALRKALIERAKTARLPAAEGPTIANVPLILGPKAPA